MLLVRFADESDDVKKVDVGWAVAPWSWSVRAVSAGCDVFSIFLMSDDGCWGALCEKTVLERLKSSEPGCARAN